MAAKLLWLSGTGPEVGSGPSGLCLISDYFTLVLTGRHVAEAGARRGSPALSTSIAAAGNPKSRGRSRDRLALAARDRSRGNRPGHITARRRERFGLPARLPVRRRLPGSVRRRDRGGQRRAGNDLGNHGNRAGQRCDCHSEFAPSSGPTVFQGPAFRQGLYWRMAFGNVSANYLQWYRESIARSAWLRYLTGWRRRVEPGAEGLRLRTDVGLTTRRRL